MKKLYSITLGVIFCLFTMKKNNFFIIILISFFLGIACTKDFELSGEYKPATEGKLKGNIMMYTRNGLITNTNTIKEFVNRRVTTIPNPYDKFSEINTVADYLPIVKFLGGGAVKIGVRDFLGVYVETNGTVSYLPGNEIKISFSDSVRVYTTGSACLRMDNAINDVIRYSRCTAYDCFYLPFFKLRKENGEYYEDVVTYMSANTNTTFGFSECFSMAYLKQDNFDPIIYQQLEPGDTIVVQRKQVKYIKQ